MITRTEIRKKIPYGYSKRIADRAGVSKEFVSKFLNNDNVKSQRVEAAVIEILEELAENRKQFEKRLQLAIS